MNTNTTTNTNTVMNTNTNIHEVVALIDRSGSMSGKENDTIDGINSTIEVLKTEQTSNTITKVSIKLFDHEEKLLVRSIDLNNIRPITCSDYIVRGQTALLDAMGNTLTYFMQKKIMEPTAYNICTIYIVTDGLENASKHYKSHHIKNMIKEAQEKYNIQILYLGANQDAILEANKYGISQGNAMNYSENSENVEQAYRSAAYAARRHASGDNISFTNAERTLSQAEPEVSEIFRTPPLQVARTRSRGDFNSPPRIRRQRSSR